MTVSPVPGLTFTAKWDGWCHDCGERVTAGDQVTYRDTERERDVLCHATCPDVAGDPDLGRRDMCPTCFMVGPCDCDPT